MHHSRPCALLIDCNTSGIAIGQRFCVVRIRRPGYPKNANVWA